MKRFTDKVALITGATYGIGFSIAKRLAQEGAKVMICSRKEENVQNAVKQLRKSNLEVHGIRCHVGDATDRARLLDETIKRFGKINILIPNVGVNPTPAICQAYECPESAWDKIFDVNVKSTFLLTQEALPHLRKQTPGSNIVYLSSIVGANPHVITGAYSVSKTALIGLMNVVAKGLATEGIRVNCVAPGLVHTPFAKNIIDKVGPQVLPLVPMARFGVPDEIAGPVAFIASDDASYVTGETLVVAGGWFRGL